MTLDAPRTPEAWPDKAADPGACARCSAHFSTCCVIAREQVECCFPLSQAEQTAIAAFAEAQGMDGGGLCLVPNSPAFISSMQALFPGESLRVAELYPAHGGHWRLRVDDRGACVFLRASGCALPRAIRPAYCRIFPFWMRRGALWHFALQDCQALRESRNYGGLLRLLGLDEPEIRALYQAIRAGWGLPPSR